MHCRIALPVLCSMIFSATAFAAVFSIANGPTPLVSLTVGSSGTTIDRVSFNVSSGQLGNKQAITGSPTIAIAVSNRAAPPRSRPATLSADSSLPLKNGSHQLLFSTISWTAQDNDIPAGSFNDSANQTLLIFDNSSLITDVHQFTYKNTDVLEAGTYTGRVTYTLTMP